MKRKIHKIIYFINTLSYLSPVQIFFLGFNKVIKHRLNRFLFNSSRIKLGGKAKTKFEIIKSNINVVLGDEELWQLGISEIKAHSHYYDELKKNILFFSKNGNHKPILLLWKEKSDDIELNYNYQRYYLFNEVFTENEIPDEARIELILTWIKNNNKNPLAWTGFNCAIRLVNWMRILKEIPPENLLKDDWAIIENSIYQQYIFISKNIEHHIPGNHVLLQFYSKWLTLNIFKNWSESNDNKQKIFNLLCNEIEKEFLNDGLHFELSSHYHLQITLMVLSMMFHLRQQEVEIPKSLKVIVSKAKGIIDHFLIGEYYPNIGDNCYNFFHKTKYQDLENLVCLMKLLIPNYDRKATINCIDNNYYVFQNDRIKILFDIGNIGMLSNPGHGHADLLSIVLGYNELPIFIDPGTYQYKNSKESLKLKRTVFHNTVSVNEEDQAKLWGFFRWAYLPQRIKSSFHKLSENIDVLEGEFYGYRHLGGINHKRIIKINSNKVIVKDNLKGSIGKKILINFILHPKIIVEQKRNAIFLKSKLNDFELKCNNKNMFLTVEDIFIYDSYNIATPSKKVTFVFNNKKKSEFDSEILFEVLDQN